MFASKSAVLNKNREIFKGQKYVGFVTEVKPDKVFLTLNSVYDFYSAQYAIAPSVLVNDTDEDFIIGIFDEEKHLPSNLKLYKKLDNRTYVFKGKI